MGGSFWISCTFKIYVNTNRLSPMCKLKRICTLSTKTEVFFQPLVNFFRTANIQVCRGILMRPGIGPSTSFLVLCLGIFTKQLISIYPLGRYLEGLVISE